MRWGLTVGVGSLVAAVLCVGGAVVGHVVAGDRDESQLTAVVAAGGSPDPGVGSGAVAASSAPAPDEAASPSEPASTGVPAATPAAADLVAARAAGVVAVSRTREVFEAGAISRRDVIAEFASKRFAPELATRTSQQVVSLLFGLRESEGRAVDVTLTSQPVTAQAHALSAERIAVDVWTVSVFVAEGQAAAAEQWSTVHLELVRESGRWLVDSWDTTLGPSPVPAPEGSYATSDEVASVLSWAGAETAG